MVNDNDIVSEICVSSLVSARKRKSYQEREID